MYNTQTPPPPVPPPKPSSHDVSRLGTPVGNSPRQPVSDHGGLESEHGRIQGTTTMTDSSGLIPAARPEHEQQQQQQLIPDPGETWLPKFLEDQSKQDLTEILGSPKILEALTLSPTTMHPSLKQTRDALAAALDENVRLAEHLKDLEARLAHQRAGTQAQLLAAHALDRQWRARQADMDAALAPFAPAAHYARLTHALQEQEMLCQALEESFLEGAGAGDDDGGMASEREVLDWVRRYRDAKRLYYLRQERKGRWNERRVGGWR
ncbi:hypothetical protein F5Y17DRAFT_460915 [Xylariaceae sp. FL0594]|nr:hypothetical protein F5Y17DRAFT_460915 [Xylariaceae sp. FL0594]